MFCPNCGNQIPDDAVFCGFCGASIKKQEGEPQPQPQPQPYQQPQPQPQPYQQPMYYGQPLTPVQQVLKEAGGSPAMLIAAICMSLGLVIELCSSGRNFTAILVELVVMIPAILMVIGLWMIWSSCRKPEPVLKGTGLCRAAAIIYAVLIGLGIAVEVIGGIVGLIGLNGYVAYSGVSRSEYAGLLGGANALIIILLLIAVGITVMCLIYYIKAASTAKAASDSMITGGPMGKLSGYVMFCNIVSIIFSIIGIITAGLASGFIRDTLYQLINEIGVQSNELYSLINTRTGMLPLLGQILDVTALICLTVALSKARNGFRTIPPVYPEQRPWNG